jgi:hypothetical protein
MKAPWVSLFVTALTCSSVAISAEVASGLTPASTYKDVKTWHEKFLDGTPPRAERLEAMREIVRTSRFGERGLHSIYKNFDGHFFLDPTIPGVEHSMLLSRSSSVSQAKGYRRELLYATTIYNDPRFSLVEMNRPIKRPWGNTDADIVFKHRGSGEYGRIEVKDYSEKSQVTNAGKLKRQIRQMDWERRLTGVPQFWMNARPATADIKLYAAQHGVIVIENVKTGASALNRPGVTSSKEALGQIDRAYKDSVRHKSLHASGSIGFGAWILVGAVPNLGSAIGNSGKEMSTVESLRIAEAGSYVLAGSGMLVSGVSKGSSSYVPSYKGKAHLHQIGRIGGAVGLLGLVSAEGLLIARYRTGDISDREFWTNQWVLGATGTGSYLGAGLGRLAGGIVTRSQIGASIGGFGGAIGGGLAGEKFARLTADTWYEHKSSRLDDDYGQRINAAYGVN